MLKTKTQKIHVDKLIVDLGLNSRIDSYNIPLMREQIAAIGRVTDPVAVEPHPSQEGCFRLLKGNRRTLGAQAWFHDPACPTALHDALEKLDCIVYEGLTERERMSLVFDQGMQQSLTRAEIVAAIWRLSNNMWTETEIILQMYTCLAIYTGQVKKLGEISRMPDEKDRQKAIKTWLHGTVGNFILAAQEMGELVREQFLLSEMSIDRALTDEEKARVQFKVNRARMTELSAAKTKDKKSEAGWSAETGGEAFNAKIEEFKSEDKGDTVAKKDNRLTVKTLESKAESAKSKDLRNVYMRVAGKEVNGFDFDSLDTELYRKGKVQDTVIAALDSIKDANVKALLFAIAYKGEVEVKKELLSFVS
jgi:hypothetical protein